MINAKQFSFIIIASIIINFINILTRGPPSEILSPSEVPENWPQEINSLETKIYYSKTFMDSINSLNPQQVAEVQNKIKEEISDGVIPYTKVFNDASQAIPNHKKSSAASSIKKIVKYDDNHKHNMPDTPKYRKLKHTTRHKMAYWVHPDMPKGVLINKLRNGESVLLKVFFLAYGRHIDIDGKKPKRG